MGNTGRLIVKSILAGMFIGIADLMTLNVENVYVSSFLFAVALMGIISSKLNLFTGKVGFVNPNFEEVRNILLIYVFNVIGVLAIRYGVAEPKFTDVILQKEVGVLANRSVGYILGMSIITGMLMYTAVTAYHPLLTIFCVAAFLLMDGKHSIALAFYVPFWKYPFMSVLIAAGNAIGAVVLHRCITEKNK